MSKSDIDVTIDLINKQLDSVARFNEKSLSTTSNIIKRLEKLEVFKTDTLIDIDEIFKWIESFKNGEENKTADLLSDTVKNKIIRNFLELSKDMADRDVQRLMAIPIHKQQDFQKEDLDNCEQVYWACKILLEYIGDYDDDE